MTCGRTNGVRARGELGACVVTEATEGMRVSTVLWCASGAKQAPQAPHHYIRSPSTSMQRTLARQRMLNIAQGCLLKRSSMASHEHEYTACYSCCLPQRVVQAKVAIISTATQRCMNRDALHMVSRCLPARQHPGCPGPSPSQNGRKGKPAGENCIGVRCIQNTCIMCLSHCIESVCPIVLL